MKRVRLDFSAPGGAWRRRLIGNCKTRANNFAMPFLAIGLAALGIVGWQSWNKQTQLTAAQDALRAVQSAKGRRPPSGEKNNQLLLSLQQRTAWNQIAQQLNMPWSSLLDALEEATPEDIAVVSIEPDGAQASVHLQVEAKTLDSLLAYAGTLRSIDLFDSIALIKHETNDQDSTRPLRLSLDLRLKDALAAQPLRETVR